MAALLARTVQAAVAETVGVLAITNTVKVAQQVRDLQEVLIMVPIALPVVVAVLVGLAKTVNQLLHGLVPVALGRLPILRGEQQRL